GQPAAAGRCAGTGPGQAAPGPARGLCVVRGRAADLARGGRDRGRARRDRAHPAVPCAQEAARIPRAGGSSMRLRDPGLDDAVQALRSIIDADEDADGDSTRRRVLATLARRQRTGRRLTAVFVALALSMSGSAAMAWRSGWLPAAWR